MTFPLRSTCEHRILSRTQLNQP
ncbi:hypothetical protein TCAL_11641 [Tigriopus californicus]|uniref:Uncharacterized protein n=1 Tax=Tigriopus californicus TaxID=6832 RepID=A0A553PI33_TIGCA|nr:hypothetical protein TCAL_11641 [Tigriopus californicus]